jgi:hypothetical protein
VRVAPWCAPMRWPHLPPRARLRARGRTCQIFSSWTIAQSGWSDVDSEQDSGALCGTKPICGVSG